LKRTPAVRLIAGGREFDSYRAEAALEAILEQQLGGDRVEAVETFRGDETSWARVLDAARTPSLFVAKRVVVVRGAEALKGDDEGMAAFAADPAPGVTLVLMASKIDRRKGIWRRLNEVATVESAEPLKGQALRAAVADAVRRRRLTLTPEGIRELIDRVGQDFRRLIGEIDKLAAYGFEGPIGPEEVASVLGRGLARPLYALTDAFAARRADQVLELMEEALDDGEAPLRLLGALHRTLRQLLGARALRAERAPREELATRLGVLPFKVGDVLAAAERWSEETLDAALEALDRADRRIKTGGEPRVALTAAVVEAGAVPGPTPASRRTPR
jgi:DNA polymerase-3 subunit delta